MSDEIKEHEIKEHEEISEPEKPNSEKKLEHKGHHTNNHHKKDHHEHKHATYHKHTKHKDDSTLTLTKTGIWQGIAAVLAILLLISIFTAGFGIIKTNGKTTKTQGTNLAAGAKETGTLTGNVPTVNFKGAHMKGDENAPVTIVEWSDFECPFCARFYSQTYGQIVSNYVDSGKVKIVFKHFPLGFHAQAQKAAEASECAGEQGKFWEMHDMLFEKGVTGSVAGFKKYAADLGLDTTKFDSCLDTGKYASKVSADMAEGQASGVTGTPGFIVQGELVVGAQPYSVFQAAIDRALG
ncbi:DsbA family protein [Candidatus Woesearchaeota archaeon]|nr:DsbA family protein [Candidatus Woesearchaeota archaeon]